MVKAQKTTKSNKKATPKKAAKKKVVKKTVKKTVKGKKGKADKRTNKSQGELVETPSGSSIRLTPTRLNILRFLKKRHATRPTTVIQREAVWDKFGGKDKAVDDCATLRTNGLIDWVKLQEGKGYHLTKEGSKLC